MSVNNSNREESEFVRSLLSRFESFKRTFYFLTRSPLAVIGLAITIFYILLGIFGDFFVKGNPWTMVQILEYKGQYIYNTPLPPSSAFPFGTTYGGYDIFNGIIKGARIDEGVAAIIVITRDRKSVV